MRRDKAASLLYPRQPHYTPQEVARRLGVPAITVYKWCQTGKIPEARRVPIRLGGRTARYWTIPHAGIVAFLRTGPPALTRR